jgi:hypothetical protein
MCALCGAFGVAEHWADGGGESALSPFAARRGRADVANRVLSLYGLKLAVWGSRFTLTSRTGKTAVVDNFGTLWPLAEHIAGRPLDPLDPKIIAAIEARADA